MSSRIVPESWMPTCGMKRVITHWTAGGHHASSNDKEHYHILIEADGQLVRGDHTIADNVSTGDGDYAAHTKGCNTGSIGVSLCCMLNAMEHPLKPGPFPMTQKQWETMVIVVADLCDRYDIEVTPKTVLGHGEVTENLGIVQNGKWDPMVLPWNPGLSHSQVGKLFREGVQAARAGGAPPPSTPDPLSPITVVLNAAVLSDAGVLHAGASWCPLRVLAEARGWTILDIDGDSARIHTPTGDHTVVAMIRGDRGFVQLRDVSEKLGWSEPVWDKAARRVMITTA